MRATKIKLQIHAYVPSVKNILGPGLRAIVWVQGCKRHCAGCILPESWDPNGGKSTSPKFLAKELFSNTSIEGITVSGGEPFEQPQAVGKLLEIAREKGLNTLVYTGYTIEELIARSDRYTDTMLSLSDVLIDGPYSEEVAPGRLRGSNNQRIHCLTDKIPKTRLEDGAISSIEVEIGLDGNLIIVGIPPRKFFQSFEEKMGKRGILIETRSTRTAEQV